MSWRPQVAGCVGCEVCVVRAAQKQEKTAIYLMLLLLNYNPIISHRLKTQLCFC